MISLQDQAASIAAASTKYAVPVQTLVGVYGVETGFGYGTGTGKTSTAGAIGPFQFEPSTAAGYGYPLTNTPTPSQFAQQADAAAHLLSDLHTQFGDWTRALAAYNAGPGNVSAGLGYAAKVQSTAQNAPRPLALAIARIAGNQVIQGGNPPPGEKVTGFTGNLNIPNPLSGIEAIAALLTSLDFWKRLGEVIAGIILVAMGLRSLTGGSVDPIEVATAAAAKVRPA